MVCDQSVVSGLEKPDLERGIVLHGLRNYSSKYILRTSYFCVLH